MILKLVLITILVVCLLLLLAVLWVAYKELMPGIIFKRYKSDELGKAKRMAERFLGEITVFKKTGCAWEFEYIVHFRSGVQLTHCSDRELSDSGDILREVIDGNDLFKYSGGTEVD